MPVRLREYRPEDFDALWSIDQECFPAGISYSRLELRHYLERRGSFALLAEIEGEAEQPLAGFTVAELNRRATGHIITLDVRPQYRRARIGSLLMDAAEARLQEQGCRSIFLETAVDNLTALAFYKRHGYSVLKTLPRYYQGKVDGLLMGKQVA